ncbi:MAG: hypothetical protein OXB94_11825 [Nitrospira sp.]|nr:hypothetical protein [Nitrospira sp.]
MLWWLGLSASFILALWMFLPAVASHFVERQFEAFGCTHVNVVVDYPGLRRTVNDNGGRDPGHFSKE